MSRTIRSLVWGIGLAVGAASSGVGCSHMIETRAITAFSKYLESEDLDGLMLATSGEFHQRALRTEAALEDLKILNLPDGKTAIVEVEEISDSRKRVTVEVSEGDQKGDKKSKKKIEKKKEVFYELAKDKNGHWVVDDIYLKQKRKGVVAYKSVTEQMDLLLSIREFIDTWSRGDREQVLGLAAPKFRSALDQLPPSFLVSLTKVVSAGKPSGGKYRPNAQMDEKVAVVRLPRLQGDTVISMELNNGRWEVSDVAVDSKGDDQLPSMLRLAYAVNGCTTFLAAYGRGDKASLAEWSTKEFFEGSLAIGELGQAKLPDAQLSEHDMQVKLRGNRADFIFKNDAELVQIETHRIPDQAPDAPPKFQVSEVTIYEMGTKQQKRLSALFTAQAMLEIFMNAMAAGDVDTLKHSSTQDLAQRVWNRLNGETIGAMPLDPLVADDLEILNTSFEGALTRVTVRQGGRPLTYMLREEHGRFFVDDVQWQITGVPASMKVTMEILVPIQEFAAAITLGRDPQAQQVALERLQSVSSSEFNRAVWAQTRFVPDSGMPAESFLKSPLKAIAITDQHVAVQFGDNRYGAKVTLRREFERYVVDDVQMIAGVEESQRLALRQNLRAQLTRGEARAPQAILPASAVQESFESREPRRIADDPFARDARE